MKLFIFKLCTTILLLCAIFSEMSIAQEKNPTTWPYGGVQDSSRYFPPTTARVPLNFATASFNHDNFDSLVSFRDAMFKSQANFIGTKFSKEVYFFDARFDRKALFNGTQFDGKVNFNGAIFDSLADFGLTGFAKRALFNGTKFDQVADFRFASFTSLADFRLANFNNKADFRFAKFKNLVDFKNTTFYNIDLRDATIDSLIDFSSSVLRDSILIGTLQSGAIQKYDFTRAKLLKAGYEFIPAENIQDIPERRAFYPGAKIFLYGPVDIKMQLEKFTFIELYKTLDYYTKKEIISVLKRESFKEDKTAQYELDYLFAKSTVYQRVSVYHETFPAFHPYAWWQFLYNATMGLGYRPFRLIWWALSLILGFGVFYIFKMPERINRYILKDENKSNTETNAPWFGRIVHCLYFSAMVFFTFRLKKDILTFFTNKEKRIIVTQWLLGFLTYVAFLTLSKSGSILQNLKDLFVG
ncbi:MAG: pentapeptide repeat-containing protein [bacterium]